MDLVDEGRFAALEDGTDIPDQNADSRGILAGDNPGGCGAGIGQAGRCCVRKAGGKGDAGHKAVGGRSGGIGDGQGVGQGRRIADGYGRGAGACHEGGGERRRDEQQQPDDQRCRQKSGPHCRPPILSPYLPSAHNRRRFVISMPRIEIEIQGNSQPS